MELPPPPQSDPEETFFAVWRARGLREARIRELWRERYGELKRQGRFDG